MICPIRGPCEKSGLNEGDNTARDAAACALGKGPLGKLGDTKAPEPYGHKTPDGCSPVVLGLIRVEVARFSIRPVHAAFL